MNKRKFGGGGKRRKKAKQERKIGKNEAMMKPLDKRTQTDRDG